GGASLDGCGDGGASRSHTGHDAGLADAEHGLVAAAPGDGAAGELLAGGAEHAGGELRAVAQLELGERGFEHDLGDLGRGSRAAAVVVAAGEREEEREEGEWRRAVGHATARGTAAAAAANPKDEIGRASRRE